MTVILSLDYPEISAAKAEQIKGRLQEQDILVDFGPGQSIWQMMFGKPRPNMSWANIVAPEWFESVYDGETEIVPLTAKGKANLNEVVQQIYDVASGPITVLCHRHKENPKGQKEFNIKEFNQLLDQEGLPYRTLIILDRRLADR